MFCNIYAILCSTEVGNMQHGITTSIRLSPELRNQLEEAASSLHRGKNWIITKALEDF
jgi:predicted DNA-binding protein